MNDIKFIRDDTHEKKIKQLQEILNVLQTRPKDSDVEAARRFFYSMLRSSQELTEKKREIEEELKKELALKEQFKPKPFKVLKEVPKPKLEQPEVPKPEIGQPEMEIPRPEDFKHEEQPKIEDAVAIVSKAYPFVLFKNSKGEAVAYTSIATKEGKITYELEEPEIDFRLVKETEKLIQKEFQKDKKIIKDEKFMTEKIKKAFKNLKIDYTEEYKEEIRYYLYKHMLGLGRIDSLIHDPNVNAIICDGLNKPVKISLGPGLEVATNVTYEKKEELDEQIIHLGKRIRNEASENHPVIEGMFYNFKIEATLGLGEAESKFVIRKLP